MTGITIKRGAPPTDPAASGWWAWTVVAANGQAARGWHSGSREEAEAAANKVLTRLNNVARVGYTNWIQTGQDGLSRSRTNKASA